MSTKVKTAAVIDLTSILKREEDAMKGDILSSHKHSLRVAAHVYNIHRNRLFEAAGFETFSSYLKDRAIARQTGYDMLNKGALIASVALKGSESYLNNQHADDYFEAKKRQIAEGRAALRLLPNHDDQCLKEDVAASAQEDDDDIYAAYEELSSQRKKPGRKGPRDIGEEKRRKRQERDIHMDNLMDTLHTSAMQSFGAHVDGLFVTAKKRKEEALYYVRLSFYFIDNRVHGMPAFVSYEDALAMVADAQGDKDQLPPHVAYALRSE